MKTKLLRKARKRVSIVNWWGSTGKESDKRLTVKRISTKGEVMFPARKGKVVYMSYNRARKVYIEEVINSAIELMGKSWIWHVFH